MTQKQIIKWYVGLWVVKKLISILWWLLPLVAIVGIAIMLQVEYGISAIAAKWFVGAVTAYWYIGSKLINS